MRDHPRAFRCCLRPWLNGANRGPSVQIPAYNRAEWQHWIDKDGDCQDTRQVVLIEETLIASTLDASGCRVVAGLWRDEYTGTLDRSERLRRGPHRVPLANAHRAGGWAGVASFMQPVSRMTEKTDAERIKGLQALSDRLDAQRKRTGDTCIAATANMRSAWEADRNEDRRVSMKKHGPGPERHRR